MDTDINSLEKMIAKFGSLGVEELAKVKKKTMTNTEKRRKAKIKKELQAEGIIPPDKPRLNRKKFIKEAEETWRTAWHKREAGARSWIEYMERATIYMFLQRTPDHRISPEAVGVAKLLKVMVRLQEFDEKLWKEGRAECTVEEQYEYIKDILGA